MDALKRKMEIAAVAFFCTVTALIAAYSCATTAAANLAQQTAAAPATEYVTLAYMEVQPEAEQEPELLYDVPMSDELQRYIREQAEQKAVDYLSLSALNPKMSTYQLSNAYKELGQIYDQNDLKQKALDAYREGLRLNSGLSVKKRIKQLEKELNV